MSDGYEPHGHITLTYTVPGTALAVRGQGRGVPGVGRTGGPGGVLYRVLPQDRPRTIFSLFLRQVPTYGQMKAILSIMMRFPIKGPERVQNSLRIDPRMTLQMTLQDWSPDGPPDPYIQTSDIPWSIIGLI